jgi:hypothetical protein
MAEPTQVRNAADAGQVNRARSRDRDKAREFAANLRAVMALPYGRAVMWELISRAGVFRSVWSPNSEIHYKAGRQDYGHELLAELVSVDEELYQLMEREARARVRRDARATEASHTKSVTQDDLEGEQT